MSNPGAFGGSHPQAGPNSAEQTPFVGLGGIQNVTFQHSLQHGGSVVTAAATGNASQANPLFASTLDLPVPREIAMAAEELGLFVKSTNETILQIRQLLNESHADVITLVHDQINRVMMDVHDLKLDYRRCEVKLDTMKADAEQKKEFTDGLSLSLDSKFVVRKPRLASDVCFDALTKLVVNCKEAIEFLEKGITDAEQLYGKQTQGLTTTSVPEFVQALHVMYETMKCLSAEVQEISEKCDEMCRFLYGCTVAELK